MRLDRINQRAGFHPPLPVKPKKLAVIEKKKKMSLCFQNVKGFGAKKEKDCYWNCHPSVLAIEEEHTKKVRTVGIGVIRLHSDAFSSYHHRPDRSPSSFSLLSVSGSPRVDFYSPCQWLSRHVLYRFNIKSNSGMTKGKADAAQLVFLSPFFSQWRRHRLDSLRLERRLFQVTGTRSSKFRHFSSLLSLSSKKQVAEKYLLPYSQAVE